MFALDLFNNDHERRLAEGAVDQLEQRRIDDLAMKMDDLVARAKTATTAEVKQALMKEFQKCKAERDSYYKVREGTVTPTATGLRHHAKPENYGGYEPEADPLARLDKHAVNRADKAMGIKFDREKKYQGGLDLGMDEAGIPGNVPVEKIPGKEDLLKGRGRSYYEGQEPNEDDYEQLLNAIAALYGPEIWDNDAMGDLANDLEQANPTPEELNFIIKHGKLPKRLIGTQFTNNDTTQFGEAAYTGDHDTDEKHIQHLMRKYHWSRQEAEEHLTSSESDREQFDEAKWEKVKREKQTGIPSNNQKKNSKQVKEVDDPQAVHDAGLKLPIASQYTGDGQFKVTVKNKPYIVTVAGFEIDDVNPGILDSFYLTDVATGKTEHVTSAVNDPRAVAIYNNLENSQRPALKEIYKQDIELGRRTDWKERPERLQGLKLSGYTAIPADRFIKGHQDMKRVTGQEVNEYISMGSDKNYVEAEPYKNYKIYVRKKPFGPSGMYTAHTEIDRKEVKATGTSQEEAVQAIRDRIDFVLNAQKKVTGSSTIDFNVKFATDLLADPRQKFYAKLENINGQPKLVIASADIASDPELVAAGDFKGSSLRNQVDDEGRATPLPGIPLTAKSLEVGGWIANGRYTIGNETTDRDGNRIFDLTYHSTAHTKSDKLRLNQPAFTLGTARELDEDKQLHVGDPITVTAPNEFEGKTGEIYELSPSGKFVIVDLYNHGKHSMHLSDIEYNQYADDQEQDDWYDDADEFGKPGSEFFPEGFQDFNRVEPYAVCLAGKPVKKFDYYEQARKFHDNWKQKLYREGNKAKADKITLMPLNLDEGKWDYPKSMTTIPKFDKDADDYLALHQGAKFARKNKADRKEFRKTQKAQAHKELMTGKKEQGVAEEAGRVDPILIKALNRMPDGLASHGEVLNAAYDAYAMELGRMQMKSNYGTTNAYVPQLLDLYKQKHGLTFNEAANPAQQAAIAIAMKKAGKKPKQVDEDTGSWIVYDPETKQIKKRFKTHTAGKSYARTHSLGFASSEYYFDNVKEKTVDEGAMSNVHAAMADVYHRLAPKIERHRDSFLAGQLYDELENIAELHGVEPEFKRMMAGARNRAHMDYDTNPGGFQNWFWYLPFDQEELSEEQDTSGVERAILNRIMVAHTDLLMKFGPDKVMQAAEEVAYNVGDVDEIGTSDVSAYVNQVRQILGA